VESLRLYENHPDGPVDIGWDFSGSNHNYYLLPEMTPITASVTGVTDKISIGGKTAALIGWACKQTGIYLDENYPALRVDGKVVSRLELTESEFQAVVKKAKSAHRGKKAEAATVGGDAHEWIDKHIKAQMEFGVDPPLPTEYRTLNAVQSYLDFEKSRRVHYIASERKVYSRKYGYVGTLDRLVEIDGVLGIEDLKTSNYFHPEFAAQIAGYEMAYMEEFPSKRIESRTVVMLSKEEAEFKVVDLQVEHRDEDFAAFLGALAVFNWGEGLNKRGSCA